MDLDPAYLGAYESNDGTILSEQELTNLYLYELSNKADKLLYVRLGFNNNKSCMALVDTGATQSAMPRDLVHSILSNNPDMVREWRRAKYDCVKLASGDVIDTLGEVLIDFRIVGRRLSEWFLILENMNQSILGMSFFEKENALIDIKNRRLQFPNLTVQISEIHFGPDMQPNKINKRHKIPIVSAKDSILEAQETTVIKGRLAKDNTEDYGIVGIMEGDVLGDKTLEVICSLSSIDPNGEIRVAVVNLGDKTGVVKAGDQLGHLMITTSKESKDLINLTPTVINSSSMNELDNSCISHEGFDILANMQCSAELVGKGTRIPEKTKGRVWFPVPGLCPDPSKLEGVPKMIYDQLEKFMKAEKLNPLDDEESRKEFLSFFTWEGTLFSPADRARVEEILVEYHMIFGRHRMDVGKNDSFKIKLTPENDTPVYAQSPPTPLHIKDELLVELALMQYYDIITTIPYSKYSSPIFAQRKPSGKLRLLVDLRRINHLIRHDYDKNNFPISTMQDAGNHLAGKKWFSKLDCSQAYFALQMGDDLSIQLLAFNFGSRTYAFKRMAQGLSRSVSAFSSYMRKYLDECIAADECTQYVDDIAIGSVTIEKHLDGIRKIFGCIKEAGLRLSMSKCQFGVKEIRYLGQSITSEGMTPNEDKIQEFLKGISMPNTLRRVQRLVGFFQFFRAYIPNMAEKLMPFYRMMRDKRKIVAEKEHYDALEVLKKALDQACKLTLRLPKANKQYVILADASWYSAGFVLMIEDYNEKKSKDPKHIVNYAPVSFGSRLFSASQLKMSIYAKEFLAVYYAFDGFAHMLWGITEKPVIVLTDNKSLTRFFQAKTLPSPMLNCIDRILQFKWVIGHIPGKANLAADYISRANLDPTEKLKLRIGERIIAHDIWVDVQPKCPEAEIDSIFSTETDIEFMLRDMLGAMDEEQEGSDSNNQIGDIKTKDELRRFLTGEEEPEEVMHDSWYSTNSEELYPSMKFSQVKNRHEEDTTLSNAIFALTVENSRDDIDWGERLKKLDMAEEQDRDENLRQVKRWMLTRTLPVGALHLTPEQTCYFKQFPRLIMKNGIIIRKFYNQTGTRYKLQVVVPKHLRTELLLRIHNHKMGGHRGIRLTIEALRRYYYFPYLQEWVREFVQTCISCCQVKPLPASSLIMPMRSILQMQQIPEQTMQVDLLGPLTPAEGKEYIVTAIDLFTKYIFAVPVTNVRAETVGRVILGICLRHAYIPQKILADQGSQFTADLMKELTKTLGIEIDFATVKHHQTIGALERAHGPFKKFLSIFENEEHRKWHHLVDFASHAHNTTVIPLLGVCPSTLFHGRDPSSTWSLRFNNKAWKDYEPAHALPSEIMENVTKMNRANRMTLLDAYQRHKRFFDRLARGSPLQLHDYVLMLAPDLETQKKLFHKMDATWVPFYRVEKVLTYENYIIRRLQSNHTSCVHRIRLRPYKPLEPLEDLEIIDPKNFTQDPHIPDKYLEPHVFDENLAKITQEKELILQTKPPPTTLPYTEEDDDQIQIPQFRLMDDSVVDDEIENIRTLWENELDTDQARSTFTTRYSKQGERRTPFEVKHTPSEVKQTPLNVRTPSEVKQSLEIGTNTMDETHFAPGDFTIQGDGLVTPIKVKATNKYREMGQTDDYASDREFGIGIRTGEPDTPPLADIATPREDPTTPKRDKLMVEAVRELFPKTFDTPLEVGGHILRNRRNIRAPPIFSPSTYNEARAACIKSITFDNMDSSTVNEILERANIHTGVIRATDAKTLGKIYQGTRPYQGRREHRNPILIGMVKTLRRKELYLPEMMVVLRENPTEEIDEEILHQAIFNLAALLSEKDIGEAFLILDSGLSKAESELLLSEVRRQLQLEQVAIKVVTETKQALNRKQKLQIKSDLAEVNEMITVGRLDAYENNEVPKIKIPEINAYQMEGKDNLWPLEERRGKVGDHMVYTIDMLRLGRFMKNSPRRHDNITTGRDEKGQGNK